jgi:curved DNA-binding protein CbpA
MIPNYYAILGVTSSASTAEIKRAYRRLARQHHPDLNAQAKDEQIKRLNEAYAVLSDPQKRAAYDERIRQARQRAEAARRRRLREEKARREPEMTWIEGMIGFVRELKKALRED